MATDKERRTTNWVFARMKLNVALSFIFSLVLMIDTACAADSDDRVKWIVDGDTIVLVKGVKVRYIGINAPELARDDHVAEPYAEEAKRFNDRLVKQKKVRLEFDVEPNDRFQRRLAYVFLEDGTFVNAEMLSQGYAYVLYIRPNVKYHATLLAAQRAAMSGKRGIWHNWREQNATYIGNKQSRRFHLPSCSSGKRIKSQNRVVFRKKWDAYWAGYAPAGRCMPVFTIPQD
ncbi:MAG: thermonuclease family protein [Desulfobacterales bacterium]|mgnify:CR=1 FL=1|jgi:micrococcal nuclease